LARPVRSGSGSPAREAATCDASAWASISRSGAGAAASGIGADVLHGVHYELPLAARLPQVVTVHDLTMFTHPEWHEPSKVAYFRRALARSLARALRAPRACRRILAERKPDVVLGGGGYVAGPAGLAGLSAGLPLVLTEADRRLGLANRLLARRARRVCLAFPIAGRDGERYVVTGRPVPAAIGQSDRAAARRRFGIETERCLLVFGGSQGARALNLCALDAFLGDAPAGGGREYHVLQIAGTRDYPLARERLEALNRSERYTLLEYEPSLADALAACDLVLARAGGSIFELAAAGRPAILVPYPHAAARHQHANAEWMSSAGAAIVIDEVDLDPPRLSGAVGELLGDPARLERMATASRGLARPDAADRVAEEVLRACSR
jgi:UDP-N-acetylglucosamine--N-acetylmuramyl-(pentapeptide) pyrophosphoryl-undecaprenol N-acetylglucosamine transferase